MSNNPKHNKILSAVLLTVLIATATAGSFFAYNNFSKFNFDESFWQRPNTENQVFDYAGAFEFAKESKEEHLDFLKEQYNIEMVMVVLPSLQGKKIENVAVKMFEEWNIGKNNNGRGVLLLAAMKEKKLKIEVGYELEHIFTDVFCDYIERLQMQTYFSYNMMDEGFLATLEEFIARIEGNLQDDFIRKKLSENQDLSGGGGVSSEFITDKKVKQKPVSQETALYYRAQPTPEKTFQRYLEWMENRVGSSKVGIYDESWHIFGDYHNLWEEGKIREWLPKYKSPHHIVRNGDYAVVLFEEIYPRGPEPHFLKKTKDGWVLDATSKRKWVKKTYNNEWYICGNNHPYMFAFTKKPYSNYVWDTNCFDDFGNFSNINTNYEYHINKYKEKIEKNPQDIEAMIGLSEILIDIAIEWEALPILQKVLEIAPEDPRPYKYIGLINRDWFWSQKTALKYLEKYHKLNPNDPKAYLYIKNAYYQLAINKSVNNPKYGDPKYLIKAAEYTLKYADIVKQAKYYALAGEYYYYAKDYLRAKQAFKKALDIYPEYEYAKWWIKYIEDKY